MKHSSSTEGSPVFNSIPSKNGGKQGITLESFCLQTDVEPVGVKSSLWYTQVNCPFKRSKDTKVHMEPSTLEEGDLTGLEVCNFGGTEIALPLELIEQPEIFFTIVSKDTWKNVLTAENRKHLEKFLPALPTDYPHAQEKNLSSLLDGDNFHFGNPVVQFQQKLNDGYYYPDVVKYKKLCQKAKYKEYKIQQQRYHRKLLREILISRQEILDQIGRQSPGEPIKTGGHTSSPDSMMIDYKVTRCLKKILTECKEECQDDKLSSDEEERGFGSCGSLGYSLTSFHMFPGMFAGFHPMMGGFSAVPYGFHGLPYPPPVHRLSSSSALAHSVITEDDFRTMVQAHRKRRLTDEDHPELDTRFIALQDIISRTNPTKKSSKPTDFSKKKDKKAKVKRRLKQKLQQKQERRVQLKVEQSPGKREEPEKIQLPIPTGKMCCFFSLIRDILNSFPDHKGNLQKVEEYVKAWQVSPSRAISSWSTQEADWVQLVYSALMFLSGSSGDASSSFIPLVDFKERPQHWKWIGSSRDSDNELEQLCQDWLQIKDQLIIRKDGITELGSSATPAARVKTDFVVRPSTEDERLAFRDQENERYANPHKAFTFRMHGFESIVGPVKGVFSKDTNLNKAREHSLLLSSRPPYVTILTLVRDAAARLPNGEGTRAEVCELLKDSQFLNPNSSDAQIHTVVSGALDRLHYERDPCVKYDSNRKVWIYLHRNRSEEEFEKIHQASAAAARAKKLQKPRVPRQQKTKDSGISNVTQSLPVPNPPQEVDFAAVHLEEERQPPAATPEETSPKVPVVSASFSPAQQDSSAMKKTSRLNTADLNVSVSPGGFTSALNTHTSVLNTADYVESSPRQPHVFGSDESRSELQDLRGQDWSSEDESSGRSSGSGNDSDSGSVSSSENELESKDYQGGGKTLPGVDQQLVPGEIHQRQDIQDTGSLDHGNLSPHQSQLTQSEYGSESESDFSNVE